MKTENKKLLFQIPLLLLGILVLFSFGFDTAAAVDASQIYVSTQGNDTWDGQSAAWNGTSGPKQTITNATGTVATNGTVYIANGTYNESGININTNMTIIGESQQNTIINGTNSNGDPIFHITGGVNVNISDLTLTGNYGAINNEGTLTVDNCNFTGNSASSGGAIYNGGTLTVTNSTFENNKAGYGGAISNRGSLTVTGSTFTNNTGTLYGGAIFSWGNSVLVTCSTFINNTAGTGGSICSRDNRIVVNFNRIIGNSQNTNEIYGDGSTVNAAFNWWGSNADPSTYVHGSVDVTSWMVLGFTSGPVESGAPLVVNLLYDNNGQYHNPANGHVPDDIPITFTVTDGTVSPASATLVDGAAATLVKLNDQSGIINATVDSQTISITKSSVYVNTSDLHNYSAQNINLTAQVNNYYGNVVNEGQVHFTVNGVDAGTVAVNNGTATTTWQIPGNWIVGTYKINAEYLGTDNYTANNGTSLLTVDGRSIVYVSTQGNDTWDGQSPAWNCTSGPKATIKNAIGTLAENGTIYIVQGIYNESGINTNTNMSIIGENQQNTIINGTNSNGDPIFHIAPGVNVNISNLTFTQGQNRNLGGAIYNEGTLTVTNSMFENNEADCGGAICNYEGTLTVSNSTFVGNNAPDVGGAIYNGGDVAVISSTFVDNSADVGGAIYNGGDMTVTNSMFVGNNATSYAAGAIYNGGDVAVISSTFVDNSADVGGAIYNGGTLNVTGSRLIGNNASEGSAIYNRDGDVNSLVNFNWIVGNSPGNSTICSEGTALNAMLNWWGSNADPSAYVSGVNGGSVNVTPWLVLNITADPSSISLGGNSTVTADLQHDSIGASHDPAAGHVPDGAPVSFTVTNGTIGPVSGALVSGNAATVFTATTLVTGNVTATVDNQPVSALINIQALTSLVVGNVTVVDGQNATLNATLTDGNGHPLGKQPVMFNVNGTGYPAVTGDDGLATVSYLSSRAGTYPVTVSYSGTADYAASCGAETLTVNPASYLYMNVTSSNGNPVVGQTFVVTYKLSNNGPDNATNVTVSFQVPEGLEFVTANVDSGTWAYNAANRTVTWTLTNVPVGDPYLNITMESVSAGSQTINGPTLRSETFNTNIGSMPTLTIDTKAQQNSNNGGSIGTITNGSNMVNAATQTVPMQKTGVPLAGLALAIFTVLGGVLVPRKK